MNIKTHRTSHCLTIINPISKPPTSQPETEEDTKIKRSSIIFVVGALAAMLLYVGSQHIRLATEEEDTDD